MLKRKTNKTETNPADTVDPEFEKKTKSIGPRSLGIKQSKLTGRKEAQREQNEIKKGT